MSEGDVPDGRAEQIAMVEEMVRQGEADLDRIEKGLREREEALDFWRTREREALEHQAPTRAQQADHETALEALRQQIADGDKPGRFGRPKSRGAAPPDALQGQLQSRQEIARYLEELLQIDDEILADAREQILELAARIEEMRAAAEKGRTTVDEGKSMLAVLRSADDYPG